MLLGANAVVLHDFLEFTAHQITLLRATTGEFGKRNCEYGVRQA